MKNNNKAGTKVKIWGKEEDSILRKLFELPKSRGGIDPEDTTKAHLEKVLNKHFPGRLYHTFRQVYRRKALKFLLGERLNGKRKGSVGK